MSDSAAPFSSSFGRESVVSRITLDSCDLVLQASVGAFHSADNSIEALTTVMAAKCATRQALRSIRENMAEAMSTPVPALRQALADLARHQVSQIVALCQMVLTGAVCDPDFIESLWNLAELADDIRLDTP